MRDLRSSALALALTGCAVGGLGAPAMAQGLQDRLEQVFGPPRDRTETGRSPVASRPAARAAEDRAPERRETPAATGPGDTVPLPSERPDAPREGGADPEAAPANDQSPDAAGSATESSESEDTEADGAAPGENPELSSDAPPPTGERPEEGDLEEPDAIRAPAVPVPRPEPAGADQADADGDPDRSAPQADAPDPAEPEAPEGAAPDGAGAEEGPEPVAEPTPAYEPPAEARTRPEESAPDAPPIAVSPEASVAAAAAIEDARLCEAELERRGVRFRTEPTVSEAECGVLRPVVIETLSDGLAVEPDTAMLCRTALSLDIWASEGVMAAAERRLGETPVALRQSSTFVCRDRASESGLSEHARGSAIDIAAFVFADREEIAVREAEAGSAEDRFLADVRRSACGPFRTVIGPGTDADHADHFHFDIAVRRNDSLYCR